MASKRVLLVSGFGPGFSSSYTVPASATSAVITGWGAYNGDHVAGFCALFVNSVGAAGGQFQATDGGFGLPLRIGLAAGDSISIYSSVAGLSVSVTVNESG